MDPASPRRRYLDALGSRPVDRPPVWLMRQAGRYLPEYRALRERHSFLECVHRPELAAELTLQPLRRFPVDAAIVFSDILIVLEAMGLEVSFPAGGPRIAKVIERREDMARLRPIVASDDFAFLAETLGLLRESLARGEAEGVAPERALIGFAGAPWTLACYALEGGGSKDFVRARAFMHREPEVTQELLTRLASAVGELLVLQLKAGADAVQLFDTWGGLLSADDYERDVLPHVANVVHRVHSAGGRIVVFVKDGAHLVDLVLEAGADAIGLDWRGDLAATARRCAGRAAVQGNIDPALLFGPKDAIRTAVQRAVSATRGVTGHVLNLGHGVAPGTPVEGVGAFVDAAVSCATDRAGNPTS